MEPHIQTVVLDVAGAIHARFGPASKDYFTAKNKPWPGCMSEAS